MKHLTEAIMEVVDGLRSEAAEKDIKHVWVDFQSDLLSNASWRVAVSRTPGKIISVHSADLRAAFDEAVRRCEWERDQAMKLIAAE